MAKKSAGILLYRQTTSEPEVFLVHPGGPFWAGKDLGAWSIPKGEMEEDELPETAALREFEEETGFKRIGLLTPLHPVKTKNGKIIYPFALQSDVDPTALKSNTFSLEWPPHSGRFQDIPEVDQGAWFTLDMARKKIHPSQAPMLDELQKLLI